MGILGASALGMIAADAAIYVRLYIFNYLQHYFVIGFGTFAGLSDNSK
jgi:hypothetical protein